MSTQADYEVMSLVFKAALHARIPMPVKDGQVITGKQYERLVEKLIADFAQLLNKREQEVSCQ
jgi:hypothetical protein